MDKAKATETINRALANVAGDDLRNYAAQAAADVLAQNWRDAVRDGLDLRELIQDVDTVLRLLLDFKAEIAARASVIVPPTKLGLGETNKRG